MLSSKLADGRAVDHTYDARPYDVQTEFRIAAFTIQRMTRIDAHANVVTDTAPVVLNSAVFTCIGALGTPLQPNGAPR